MAKESRGRPSGKPGESKTTHSARTPWTEEQLVLLYSFLPLMRTLCDLTGREFSAIAMKFANLLAVETTNREGLANASALDRSVVRKYRHERDALEKRVASLLQNAGAGFVDLDEVREAALDLLKGSEQPMNVETIAYLLAARAPTVIPTTGIVRDALRSSTYVVEVDPDLFIYEDAAKRDAKKSESSRRGSSIVDEPTIEKNAG